MNVAIIRSSLLLVVTVGLCMRHGTVVALNETEKLIVSRVYVYSGKSTPSARIYYGVKLDGTIDVADEIQESTDTCTYQNNVRSRKNSYDITITNDKTLIDEPVLCGEISEVYVNTERIIINTKKNVK